MGTAKELEWTTALAIAGLQGPSAPTPAPGPDKGKQRSRQAPPSSFMGGGRRVNGTSRGGAGVEPSDSLGSSMNSMNSMKALLPPVIKEEPDDYTEMVMKESGNPRSSKARRRDMDDDHSMSSADLRSSRRMSIATTGSDPGQSRPMPQRTLRERPSALNMARATSHSSLRSGLSTGNSSLRGYSSSARSSTSLEQGFLENFAQASMNAPSTGGSGAGTPHVMSPAEMHSPLLHPFGHHHPSPSPRALHPHHLPRAPQSSSSSLSVPLGHPNALAPMLSTSQHSSTVTLPPFSSISSPPPPGSAGLPPFSPTLTDKGSYETLHGVGGSPAPDISMSPSPKHPVHSMFHVVSTLTSDVVNAGRIVVTNNPIYRIQQKIFR